LTTGDFKSFHLKGPLYIFRPPIGSHTLVESSSWNIVSSAHTLRTVGPDTHAHTFKTSPAYSDRAHNEFLIDRYNLYYIKIRWELWLGGFHCLVLVWGQGLMVGAGYQCKWPSITLHSKSDRPLRPQPSISESQRPLLHPFTNANPIEVIRNYEMPLKVCRKQLLKPYISRCENILTAQDYRFLIPAVWWGMPSGGVENGVNSLCRMSDCVWTVTGICVSILSSCLNTPLSLIDRLWYMRYVGV